MRRVTKYKNIQIALRFDGYTNQDIAEHIGRSTDYVSKRFCLHNNKPFNLKEAYAILDLVGIPRERIFEYFPPDGESRIEN